MRKRFLWDKGSGNWVEFKRNPRSGPILISDNLSDVRNPVDGKIYDSKSRYYRTVKESGCFINDQIKPVRREVQVEMNLKPALARAIEPHWRD